MNNEDITAIILMPAVIREVWRNPASAEEEDIEACLEVCAVYHQQLDSFAFNDKRPNSFYEDFRKMLSRFSPIFQKDYPLVEFITNKQVDYALEKIKEARAEYAQEYEISSVE